VAEIASIKPDLICLPEVFPVAGLDKAEKVSEKDTELLCNLAKKYCTYIIGSVYERRGGKVYNTALVTDRKGDIIGRYDKIHPTEGEMKEGVLPGKKEQSPVKTDFGTVGIQICFDANWPPEWQDSVERGADLIVFSSAFPAGTILNSLAVLNKVYIVPAIWSLHSGIIDNTGRWVVQTDRFSLWVWAEIDLERTVFHWDYQGDKVKAIRRKYGDKLKIETFGPEAWFVLEPTVPDISISDVAREFKLVTYRDYIKRATGAQDRKR